MSSSTASASGFRFITAAPAPLAGSRSTARTAHADPVIESLLPVITTSLAAHFLLIGLLGSGLPSPLTRSVRHLQPVSTTAIIEQVKLDVPPPQVAKPPPQASSLPAAPIDAPIPAPAPVAAVPSSVPVAFAIPIEGPVRLVSDAAAAFFGRVGQRALAEPIALDADQRRQLVLPPISYPALAKRHHLTGTVVVEFKTSPTGEIFDARVNESSGCEPLDRAALDNLRQGRWSGAPGFYAKAYEFSLN